MTCPRCGLPGYDEPGEGHLCFHPTTRKQYADQVNEDLHRVFPPNPPPESPAQEQPREQNAAPGTEEKANPCGRSGPVSALDTAAMVKRLRADGRTLLCESHFDGEPIARLLCEAAAMIEKLGQGWTPKENKPLPDFDSLASPPPPERP